MNARLESGCWLRRSENIAKSEETGETSDMVFRRFVVSVLFISAIILAACGPLSPQEEFSLDLVLSFHEQSLDSNSVTESISMDGYHGVYSWTYEGYLPEEGFDRRKKDSFALSEEQLSGLKAFITDKGLNQNLQENKSTDGQGTAVSLNFSLSMDGKTSSITISGMSAIWSGGSGEGNLENFAYIEASQDLISYLKETAELYED